LHHSIVNNEQCSVYNSFICRATWEQTVTYQSLLGNNLSRTVAINYPWIRKAIRHFLLTDHTNPNQACS